MIHKISRVFLLQLLLMGGAASQTTFQIGVISEASKLTDSAIPFWARVNRWGNPVPANQSLQNIINLSNSVEIKNFGKLLLGAEGFFSNINRSAILPELYIGFSTKNFRLMGGRKKNQFGENYSPLSLGSMIRGSNALPIPRISFSIPDYYPFSLLGTPFQFKGGISQGWLDKGIYLEAPLLHEKWLYVSYDYKKFAVHLGLVHAAIWGGATREFGQQPDTFNDFLRVFFLLDGSSSATSNEQTNTLGNHLGMWDAGIWVQKSTYKFHFYLQHPFEDQSGARWLLNYPDGLWGISFHKEDKNALVTDGLLEFLYTKHQSGSEESSDSTYGWDDYYNNYLFRGGWVYEGRVIGNPMFTLGRNEIRDYLHVVNNRIIALHTGFEGKISSSFGYRALITYSLNYGTFHDKDRSEKRDIDYFFGEGLKQFSYRFDLKLMQPFNLDNLNATISVIGDRGELYENSNMILLGLEWKNSF